MRNLFALVAIAAVAVSLSYCKPRTQAPLSGVRDDDSATQAARDAVLADIEVVMKRQKCLGCHDIDEATDWAIKTKGQNEHLISTEVDPNTGQPFPDFMPDAANIHGIYKAYPEYFKRHFDNKQNGGDLYSTFEEELPPESMMRFKDRTDRRENRTYTAKEDFDTMLDQMIKLAGLRNSGEVGGACTTSISNELANHIKSIQNTSWAARHLEGGLKSTGCSAVSRDPEKCFMKGDRWPDMSSQYAFTGDVPGTRVVQLADVGQVSYWSRSSIDGRFVGNGGGGGHIDDIQSEPKVRWKLERTSYDPGFFPDGQGFTFHGGGAIFCDMQALLGDTDGLPTETIGGEEWKVGAIKVREDPRCNTSDGVSNITTYQSIGSGAIPGAKNYVVTGSHKADPGSVREDNVDFAGELKIFEIEKDGQSYGDTTEIKVVQLPGEGDYSLSPTSKFVVGRWAGRMAGSERPQQIAYRIRSMDAMLGDSFEAASDQTVSTICVKGSGSKPMFSLDERFISYHQYVDGASQIYITDLLNNGKTYRVTNFPQGVRALFPHFRADGWLYFQVKGLGDSGKMMATNAAVLLSR